ncbi:DUF2017 family protein [Actinomyces trachealis]|uniref:DUF2017 family protein n=1 Tax=Actinomyces trachealis TaxID=2763540 RepID=UPI0018928BCF|nr:DUF2017 family protein [Actinomyces trachealis]
MHAFEAVVGGFHSALEPWERIVLEDLVREVSDILRPQLGGPAASRPSGSFRPTHSGDGVVNTTQPEASAHHELTHLPPGVREGESLADAQALAALDFEPGEGAFLPGPAVRATDPALVILLPQASEDPQLATELAELTREPLRAEKHRRLVMVARELLAPSGLDGAVHVPAKQLPDWLGALNDLRLFLSQRLEITTPQTAEAAHEEVLEAPPVTASPKAHLRHMRVVLYEMVTWWQESLLAAVEEN